MPRLVFKRDFANEVSEHAIDMFIKRSGRSPSKRNKAKNTIINLIQIGGLIIGRDKIYCRGWIMVIRGNKIVTIYKPTKLEAQKLVYNNSPTAIK